MRGSYVEFSLIGAYSEEFISSAMEKGIKLYDLHSEKNILYCRTAPKNYKRLAAYARQFRVRMRIVEKQGIIFKAVHYKKRYGIALGILCYCAVIFFCSGLVWDIRISGNSAISDALILEMLADSGIKAGASNSGLQCKQAEFRMLLALDKLAWISVENEGSRIYVKVSERLDEEKSDIPIGTPCNVVAGKSGQIVETEVYKGTMLYPLGSGVAEGDIIVSGVVNDGAGNLSYNHANAKIIAEYTEKASFYVPFTETKIVTGDTAWEKEYIRFFSFTIPHQQVTAEENLIYKTDDHIVTIFGIQMPWKIRKIIATRTEEAEVTRTADRVKAMLLEQKENYEKNYLDGQEILEAEVQYIPDENGIAMEVIYKLKGNIAVLKEISIN